MLADLILLVHFALAAFIVLGLPLVWIGAWLDWDWMLLRSWMSWISVRVCPMFLK